MLFKWNKYSSEDYTVDMLPHNRREVFFDVLKLNWRSFLLYGLLFIIISLPLHTVSLSATVTISQISGGAADYTPELLSRISAVRNNAALLKIPCFIIIAAGLSGFINVLRRYAWGENVHFATVYHTGFKNNIGQMLLLGLLVGLGNFAVTYLYGIFEITEDILLSMAVMLLIGVVIFIGIPVAAYTLACISLYNSGFFKNIYVSFFMLLGSAWRTLITLLCFFLPSAIELVPSFYFMLFGKAVFSFIFPTMLFAWMLFAYVQFDNRINETQYPELVGRGTYPIAKDNDDTKIQTN